MGVTIEDYYLKYFDDILQNVNKFLNFNHPELAEDIVHEVFLKLMSAYIDLSDTTAVSKWLYVVSRNTTLNVVNKRKRFVYAEMLEENENPQDMTELMDYESNYVQQLNQMQMSISFLSPQKAFVIQKYKLEEKPLETVAAEMNVSVHTVKYYYKQAIQQIRASLHIIKKLN